MKAADIAWIAWSASGPGWQARCLREKSARKRRASGADSVVRILRRVRIVGSWTVSEWFPTGPVAEGAIFNPVVENLCWTSVYQHR